MARFTVLPAVIISTLLLSACAAPGDAINTVRDTASGALKEAQLVKQRAEQELQEAKNRANDVRQGVQKLQEGKDLLQRGLTGTGS